MAPNLGGNSASPQPEPVQRTVISHRDVTDFDSDDDEIPTTNGTSVIPAAVSQPIAAASKQALMEAAVDEDEAEDGAQALAAAATAAIADVAEDLVEGAVASGLGAEIDEVDIDVDVDIAIPETQTATQTSIAKGRRRKSASATPAATKATKATKPAKSAVPKKAAASKVAASADQVEFAGEVGPDTRHEVDNETEWEIERIAAAENDGKTLLVKWRGWKGFWEEDRDDIAASVPELVAAFEKKQKAGKGGRAGKKAASAKSKVASGSGVKKARGPTPSATKKGPLAAKTKGLKVAKSPAKRGGRPAKATKATTKAETPEPAPAASPKKSTAKSPAKSSAKKSTPKKAAAAKRGPAAKKTGVGVKKATAKAAPPAKGRKGRAARR